jgi:hypothetical protein
MFSGLFPPIPLLLFNQITFEFDADVVQSVVKRSDDTHEFCKLASTELVTKLTSQTDRQVPYYKTVSFLSLLHEQN